MHDADKRISRDTYQEGEDEAGWRPHGPKPHLEEKSIDLSSTSMTVPPTTTGGCPASTPELKSLFELSGVGQKNFEHMGLGGPPASTMVVLALGRGSGPSSEPDGHQLLDLVQPATVRSPLIPPTFPGSLHVTDSFFGKSLDLSETNNFWAGEARRRFLHCLRQKFCENLQV